MGRKKSIEDYLSIDKWYHGTTLVHAKNIKQNGIDIKHNIGHELDFGYGFYLTPYKEQAERYIVSTLAASKVDDLGLPLVVNPENYQPVVMEFDFTPIEFYDKEEYNFRVLNKYNEEFADFIFHNRVYNTEGESHHEHDFIFGVMSDSLPILLIQQYKSGEKSKEEVLAELQKATSVKQISIHNQEVCDILNIQTIYDISTGEELNIDDES